MHGKVMTWQDDKERVINYYHTMRARLITAMGGRCKLCGSRYKLEFHHSSARKWVASNHNRWVRLAKYRRDYIAGILVLLCKRCNLACGKPDG